MIKTKASPFGGLYSSARSFLIFASLLLLYASCRKPDLEQQKPKASLQTMNGTEDLTIDVSDIVAKLPKTMLHNLGMRAKIYPDKAEWQYNSYGLIMRIPTSDRSNNTYIYASKSYADPSKTHVYLVAYTPPAGSASNTNIMSASASSSGYSGKQIWVDLQDWKAYGIEYQNNQPVNYLTPQTIVVPDWESKTVQHGHYLIDGNGTIVINPGPPLVPMSAPNFDCPGEGTWLSDLFSNLGGFFGGFFDWVGGIFDGEGGNGTPPGEGTGGGWGGNPGGYGNGNANPGGNPGGPGGDGYGGGGWPPPPGGGGGGPNPGPDPGGPPPLVVNGNSVGTGTSAIALTEVPDANGFLPSRLTQLQIYLQSKPDGMIDCNLINALPMNIYQEVGSYQVPQSVRDRIDYIRNQNAPTYTASNFKIRDINDAHGGVVNCDYFFIRINSLPYLNGFQMTADQFLDYFRTHLNDFISPSVGVSFQPYIDFVAGSVNINETSIWNSSYENSLGSIVHLDMLLDGSVVESQYVRQGGANMHHRFTVTTMYTPLDGNHPVAGNRQFGIFQSNGAYYFYICGVDRTNDWVTTVANLNVFGNQAFSGADDLWHSVQSHILDFCDTHQGDAFMAEERIARPEWTGVVKNFLLGQITLQQMKAALHCP